MCLRRRTSRTVAHIGIPLSCLVDRRIWRFVRLARFVFLPSRLPVNPPPATAARLDSAPLPLPERSRPRRSAGARRSPVQGHRADPGLDGIPGLSDVTAKYLASTLPSIEITWIRFMAFALIMMPAMIPGSPLYALTTRRRGCISCAAPRCSAPRCSSSPVCGFLPIAEASATGFVAPLFVTALSIIFLNETVGAAALDRNRGRPPRRDHHPAAGHRRRFTPPRSSRWSRLWPGRAR